MRPSKLRGERQNQYNYMTPEEYQNDLKKQVEEKKRQQLAQKIQDQQEILDHYKNYDLGADSKAGGELPVYMTDLDQLLKNKQRDLETYQAMSGGGAYGKDGLVFQGDMNAFAKNIQPQGVQNERPSVFENKGAGLWDDQFIKNYKQNAGVGLNNNIENQNIINSIFENLNQPTINVGPVMSTGESDRERRLKLRDMERQKKQQGILSDGAYGKIESQIDVQAQDISLGNQDSRANIFGENQNISKRDQIWQQKQQQRAGSASILGQQQRTQQNSQFQPLAQQQLPIYQNQAQQPSFEQNDNHLRNSRVALHLNEAIKLDQTISQDMPPSENKGSAIGIIPMGDNELDQRRRDNEKRMRQQEYQQFIAKQNMNKPNSEANVSQTQQPSLQNPIFQGANSVPSSSQSNQRPSHSQRVQGEQPPNTLMAGGLQQLGVHQFSLQEEKLKKQREYREMLDKQSQQKQQNVSERDRRSQISDQVFQEVMSSHQKFVPNQHFPSANEMQQQPTRGYSAVEGMRKGQNDLSQASKQDENIFFKNQPAESDKKKQELDKKKEYAMELQQQMALKQQQQPPSRRRGTSQAVPQQQRQANDLQSQQQNFGHQQIQQPSLYSQPYNQPQIQPQFQNMQGFLPTNLPHPHNQFQQNYQQPQFNQNEQFTAHPGYQQYQEQPQAVYSNQPPIDQYQNATAQPNSYHEQQDAASIQRQKQEQYRRELENQIKLKKEKDQQLKMEQENYNQKADKEAATHNFHQQEIAKHQQQQQPQMGFQQQMEIPQSVQLQQQQQQNFTRQRTDLSKQNDPNQEQQLQLKKASYQEELQKQIQEKKQRVEEEKLKIKQHDERLERQKEDERQQQYERENNELIKEGKRDPNYQGEKKRNIRRDQFEPSTDNPTVGGQVKQPLRQDEQAHPSHGMQKDDFFSKKELPEASSGFQLPINNRKEELFGGIQESQGLPVNQRDNNLFGNNAQNQFSQPSFQPRTFEYQQQQQPVYQQYQQPPQMDQNQQMVTKMMEEQNKMIQMYQQALEQILSVKNQFFEQAVYMRDNIAKEREQLQEYEKLKSQQANDITQIQAVHNKLGSFMQNNQYQMPNQGYNEVHQQQQQQLNNPVMNPQFQKQLNTFLYQQKQDIDRMSQSGGFVGILQNNRHEQTPQQYPKSAHINQNYSPEEPNILEQSLSSDTKLIIVPQNKLAQIAAAHQSNNPHLLETWKQEQASLGDKNQNLDQSSLGKSLSGTSQLVGAFLNSNSAQKQQQNPLHGNNKVWGSRPPTSQPPETIQELPNQEDDVNKSQSLRQRNDITDQEIDFNAREDAISQSQGSQRDPRDELKKKIHDISLTINQNAMTSSNPLGNTTTINENLHQIDMILNQHAPPQTLNLNAYNSQVSPSQNKMIQPQLQTPISHAGYTQSSFYNHTMQQQKLQEQTQQEELQRQMMRIFGNTMQSDNTSVIKEAQQEHSNNQYDISKPIVNNPLQIAAQNEIGYGKHDQNENDDDYMMGSQINIASSVTGTNNLESIIEQANKRFSSNGFYQHHNQYEKQDLPIEEELKYENDAQYHKQEAKEVSMGTPLIHQHEQDNGSQQEDEDEHEQDLWNDPDMVQPPVVVNNEEDESDYQFVPHLNMSQSNRNYYQQNDQSVTQDGTLKNLQMFSPPAVSEGGFNLGQVDPNNDVSNCELEESKSQYNKPLHHILPNNNDEYQENANHQITKKEQDMMELAKLIQRATETTNTLFENSENFKFKIRSDDKQKGSQFANRKQSAKKHIKIGDPFKNADSRTLRKQPTTETEGSDNKRDRDILDNIDKIINNLEGQKQRISELGEQQMRPQQKYKIDQDSQFLNSNVHSRPVSGVSDQSRVGKYAQMALSSANDQQQKSTKQLGKFAQMALQNSDQDGLINTKVKEEVMNKYGGDTNQHEEEQEDETYKKQILRPVSGKSNSNRYQIASATSKTRSGKQQHKQQPFYDEESEENNESRESKQGFNIAEFQHDE